MMRPLRTTIGAYRDARAARVSAIMECLKAGDRLKVCKDSLWGSGVLNRTGNSLACRYGNLGMGGTHAGAAAQLVRYVRGLPRAPVSWWMHWCSPNIGLADRELMLAALQAAEYDDPQATTCVFCHDPNRRCIDGWGGWSVLFTHWM